MSSPPKKYDRYGGGVLSALNSPEYDVEAEAKKEKSAKKKSTNFQEINQELGGDQRPRYIKRTVTDYLIDFLTPLMIFIMVLSVVWYLLDVRFIFIEESNYIRMVSFCLIMGIVALNRVVAQDNSGESVLYVFGLVIVTGFYSMATTPIASGLAFGMFGSTFINITIVAFLWWITNRLMHECCVDENRTAGDVGILTGTMREFQKAVRPKEEQPKKSSIIVSNRPEGHVLESGTIEGFDPHEWEGPDEKGKPKVAYQDPSMRMAKRHPGISVFYFAAVAMVVFILGLPVILQGGDYFVLRGHLYVGTYTTAALTLLLLTSLGGLRQYFLSRNVHFPATIGIFWLGLGSVMIGMVLFGALSLPMPSLPAILEIEEHKTDFFTKNSSFELQGSPITGVAKNIQDSGILYQISNSVLMIFALFILFSMMRFVGGIAAWAGRHRDYFPNFVVEFFSKIDAFLVRYVRLPSLPKPRRLLHVKRSVAQSSAFANQMRGEANTDRNQVTQYVAHAYDALCALAYDMGVPKKDDQTPYEFIDTFPEELSGLKQEAHLLTDMYVRAAYSELDLDKKALDQLRQFWFTYDKIRARYIR